MGASKGGVAFWLMGVGFLAFAWWAWAQATTNRCPANLQDNTDTVQMERASIEWADGKVEASIVSVKAECIPIREGWDTSYRVAVTAYVTPKIHDREFFYATTNGEPLEHPIVFEARSIQNVILAQQTANYRIGVGPFGSASVTFTGLPEEVISRIVAIVARWEIAG